MLPIGCNLAINWKKNKVARIFRHYVIIKFFLLCRVFLVKFNYWSMFHVNIITGSGVMTIFVYKELKYPRLNFAQYLETRQIIDTKFGTNVSNKMLLNIAKCQGYSFYRFWAIKEKPTGREENWRWFLNNQTLLKQNLQAINQLLELLFIWYIASENLSDLLKRHDSFSKNFCVYFLLNF